MLGPDVVFLHREDCSSADLELSEGAQRSKRRTTFLDSLQRRTDFPISVIRPKVWPMMTESRGDVDFARGDRVESVESWKWYRATCFSRNIRIAARGGSSECLAGLPNKLKRMQADQVDREEGLSCTISDIRTSSVGV